MITVKYSCFENSKIKVQSANNNFRPRPTPNRIQLFCYLRSQLFHLVPDKNSLSVASQIVLCTQTVLRSILHPSSKSQHNNLALGRVKQNSFVTEVTVVRHQLAYSVIALMQAAVGYLWFCTNLFTILLVQACDQFVRDLSKAKKYCSYWHDY